MNRRKIRTTTALLLALASAGALGACSSNPAAEQRGVLPHPEGAAFVNITCPDGTWHADDGDEPVEIREGAQAVVTDPETGETTTVICVPENFPRFGNAWIGRWATVSIMENATWRTTLRALMTGTNNVNSDEHGAKSVYHQLIVDPNGTIRHYTTGDGLPAALEHNPVTNGLVGYDEGTQASPAGIPPTGATVLLHDVRPDGPGLPVSGRITATDPDLRLDWHDYTVLPDGNVLALGYQLVEETPNSRARLFRSVSGCDAEDVSDYKYTLRTRIVEYSPDGTEIRTWRSEDHVAPTAGMPVPAMFSMDDGNTLCALDIEHANAIDITPDGNVIVGFRNAAFSAALVSWPDGEILWTLGGEPPHALEVRNDPLGGTQASHDAHITRDGQNIHLHLLDNNSVRGQSRYVRYLINTDARTAELVTETRLECHGRPCYSLMMGSVNVLDEDGDTVEILANTGSVLGEDLTVDLDGVLLHYRGERLVKEIPLGDWWAYRVALLPGEPWTAKKP